MHKFLAYFCTAMLLASCGKVAQSGEEHRVFRMNLPTGLSTLDPAYAGDQASWWMTAQLYNTLVEFDTALQIRPSIATHWELSEDGLVYTFHLRKDVHFHKHPVFGASKTRRLTAQDVLFSFTRICDSAVAARGFWIFNGKVAGAEAYNKGREKTVTGFSAPDDSTFTIRLEKAYPPFLMRLAMPYASIVPQEAVQKYGKEFRSNPVGSGPFLFKSWQQGRSLILHRNPDYWEKDANGQALPYMDAVHARFITERLTEFVELCQGRIDFVNGMDKTTRDEVFKPDGSVKEQYLEMFSFQLAPTLNTEFVSFQTDSSLAILKDHPLRDRRVRLAMSLAIDRPQLVNYVLNGMGTPAIDGIVPVGMPGYDAEGVQGHTFQPELAAKLLKEAGYPGGIGLPTIVLYSNPSYQAIMEFLQKSWERIGVKVNIDNLDGPTLREKASKGEIHMWRGSWMADYPDPENYLGLFYSPNIPPNGANRSRYQNAAFDALFDRYLTEPNDSLRHVLQVEMENQVQQDAPLILLFYDRMIRMVRKPISGLETNAMNMLILKRVKKAS